MLELTATVLLLLVPLLFLWLLGLLGSSRDGLRDASLSAMDDLLASKGRIENIRLLLGEFHQTLRGTPDGQRELALAALAQIQHEFFRLEYLLSRAAKFLPELTFSGELKRLSMSIEFRVRCELIRLRVLLGWGVAPGLNGAAEKLDRLTRLARRTLAELARGDHLPLLRADLQN